MMKIWGVLTTALMMFFGGEAASAQNPYAETSENFAKVMKGYKRTGEYRQCIRLSAVYDDVIVDDYNIVYKTGYGKTFLMQMPNECTTLYVTHMYRMLTRNSKICSGTPISIMPRTGGTGITCRMGSFEVLEKIKAPKKKKAKS